MLEHDSEASPAAEPDVTLDSSTGTDATATASADVKTEEAAPSLLDVISNVVEPKSEDPLAEASSAEGTEKTDSVETDTAAAPAEAAEDFKDLPFGRHPRFQEILTQRNTFRTEVEGLKAQVTELKAPADNYSKIETFLEQNGITNDEMVNLFKVAALAKSDPDAALKELSPLLGDLYERTGAFLPDDLKTEVEEGKITEERARELSRARAASKAAEHRATVSEERAVKVETTTQTERQRAELQTALADWEAGVKAKDPDFAAKEDLIADRCRTLIAENGQPASTEAMKALLDQAHTDVTAKLRKLVPAREEVQRGPRNGSSTSSATVAPKSLLEAVSAAAAQGR